MVTPDQEIVIFHYRLGVAITQWSYVEMAIGDIAINLFPAHDNSAQAVALALHTAEGFRAKMKFADEIVKKKLAGNKHLEQWETLVARARKCSQRRNELAHWALMKYWDMQAGKRVVLSPWIRPKPKDDKDRSKPAPGSMRIMDLVICAEEFQKLGDSFQEFFQLVYASSARLRESPEPKGDRMTVHKLKRQIAEVFSAPQKPSPQKS